MSPIHEINGRYSYFVFISQSLRRFKQYLAQSCDCMIGAFRNSGDRERGWLKHFLSQTVRARELLFQMKVHFPPPVMCHTSYVTCQVSPCRILRNKVGWVPPVTCPVSQQTCQILKKSAKGVKLVGGGSVISEATLSSLVL